jgi:hypothetical protein
MPGYSYADVVERLFSEFEDHYSLPDIVEIVHVCREQLEDESGTFSPQQLERLARQRLTSAARPEGASADR